MPRRDVDERREYNKAYMKTYRAKQKMEALMAPPPGGHRHLQPHELPAERASSPGSKAASPPKARVDPLSQAMAALDEEEQAMLADEIANEPDPDWHEQIRGEVSAEFDFRRAVERLRASGSAHDLAESFLALAWRLQEAQFRAHSHLVEHCDRLGAAVDEVGDLVKKLAPPPNQKGRPAKRA